MNIIEKEIQATDYLTKSNLPSSDYVINPYVGCPHGCMYCYARFMKRFTNHSEKWGDFIDIKKCSKNINIKKLTGKTVFLSSVTDCYNRYEEKYCLTRKILEQLQYADCTINISTKSDLILRDIDFLKKMKDLKVAMSVNTLDENVKNDMDKASSIADRLYALKELHRNNIYTVLFMSPIIPGLTDFRQIIEESAHFIDEYWMENLNLRGEYKASILNYINEKFPQYSELYKSIYVKKDNGYWESLSMEIEEYCKSRNINYINFFYHDKLVQKKSNK
ncbi:MAG: radical SAM protein [Ruminococcus sp.]|nr:radical SAM protein [Ruminococcus sp.]